MPLPTGNEPWLPRRLDAVTARLDVWSAWYSGDPDRLSDLYGGTLAGDPGQPLSGPLDPNRPGIRGRIGRTLARWFWGTPTPATERRTKLHLPLAGDIAATSADLLFSEPPTFRLDNKATQGRLDELVADGLHTALLEAAEVCAGLGGVYLRVCWDDEVAEHPWLDAVHADAAIPEWRYGRLTAATLWRVVARDGNDVWRHLERHERGTILHGLYKGGLADLGKPTPLGAQDATRGLAPVVETGVEDGLTAAYVPNIRPARCWRDVPEGAHLGRADYAGSEGLMDALDETYSSLMRDIRLAKARLIVPEAYLQSKGPGQGAEWDSERELYSTVDALMNPSAASNSLAITPAQFQIRVEEHLRTAGDLRDQIVRAAGYSASSFGAADDAEVQQTATEVSTKDRRSSITRDRKIAYWTPALGEILRVLLAVDADRFNSGVTADRPDIRFGDEVSEDPERLAQTAQFLLAAEAASTQTRVQLVHPDWDETQVREEVKLIRSEQVAADPMGAPDPAEAGMGSEGAGSGVTDDEMGDVEEV